MYSMHLLHEEIQGSNMFDLSPNCPLISPNLHLIAVDLLRFGQIESYRNHIRVSMDDR